MIGGTPPAVMTFATLGRVLDDLTAARRVPDENDVAQIKRVDQFGQVPGVGLHVVSE
jgi:hypothetical protein